MSSPSSPEPQESVALVPPVRRPPTATGDGPLSPDERPRHFVRFEPAPWLMRMSETVRRVVDVTLDVADELADEVASALGLRERPAAPAEPSAPPPPPADPAPAA